MEEAQKYNKNLGPEVFQFSQVRKLAKAERAKASQSALVTVGHRRGRNRWDENDHLTKNRSRSKANVGLEGRCNVGALTVTNTH